MNDMVQAALFAGALTGEEETGAAFSHCGQYRYSLWRMWDHKKPRVLFLMLNPSTADEVKNDPTVERCQRRAVQWGFGGLYVGNIFALRSTDPQALYTHADPISNPVEPTNAPGQANNIALHAMTTLSGLVVCGWGEHGALRGRGREVLAMLRRREVKPHALRMNKSGQPAHPLYIPYSATPFEVPHA